MAITIAGQNYQGRQGELRLLDNSQSGAGVQATPYGISVKFEQMNFSANPRGRPEELSRMNREQFDDCFHLQIGSEEDLVQPTEGSFSFFISSGHKDAILEFMGLKWISKEGASTADSANPWNVKGTPSGGLVTTKARALTGEGRYGGGIIDSKGSAVKLPAFADKKKVAVDIESIWFEVGNTNRWGVRAKECFFPPDQQNIGESADSVELSANFMMYGTMDFIESFTPVISVLSDTVLDT
jgi:hypothetical protein